MPTLSAVPPVATDLDAIYAEAGAEWDVHPDLLRAVAGQESGHTRDPDRALSPAGAQGRMQLMPGTAQAMGVTDTTDPRQNIFGGAKYLSQQLDTYGRVDHALAAYNAGPGRVNDYLAGRGGLPAETQAYIPGVASRYQALVSQRQPPAAVAPATALPYTAPDATQQAPDQPSTRPYVIGDSLALGVSKFNQGGVDGTGIGGRNPSQILGDINALPDGHFHNRPMILSTGASNDPGRDNADALSGNVQQQIDAGRARGAGDIRILGVGERFSPVNATLQAVAQRNGATFVPVTAPMQGGDGVHPGPAGYRGLGFGEPDLPVPPVPPGTVPPVPVQPMPGVSAPMAATPRPRQAVPAPAPDPSDAYGAAVGADASAAVADPRGQAAGGAPAAAVVDPYTMAIGTSPPPVPVTGPPSLMQDVGDTLRGAGQALGVLEPAAPPPGEIARLGDPNKPRSSEDRIGPTGTSAPSGTSASTPPSRYGQLASDAVADNLAAARAADAARSAEQRVQEALNPAPGTTYSSVLPFAKDDATGAVRLALPSAGRDMLQGLYDLSQGPATGTVTPEGTMALAGGLGPSSAARGSTRAIAERTFGQGRNEADDYLGSAFRANPQYVPPPPPDVNLLAGAGSSASPVGGALAATPGPISMPVPGVAAPSRPLSFPSLGPNPLQGTPAPAAAPAASPAAAAAASPSPAVNLLTGATAEKGPANPFLPIVSQKGAASRVDDLLAHFGQGGNLNPAGSPLAGSPVTLAQATGNAGYAALENGLRSTDPRFSNLYDTQAKVRTQVRNQTYQGIAGSTGDVEAAEAARDAATSTARNAAFANPAPVDAQPFVDTINGILASPDGKRDTVTRALQPLLDKAKAADGSGLETDPAQLYGLRKAIGDQLSSVGTQEGADARAATRQLMQARDSLDGVIESGAPGFGAYIDQHAAMSRPIDGQRWLQAQNVTDAQGNIVLSKLDSTVKRLDAQRAKPGASLADGVTDDQIATMRTLRDDMRLEAATNAAKPVGSNTVQTLATSNALAAGKWGANAAAAVGGGLTANPLTWGAGGVPGAALRYGLGKLGARGERLVQDELRNRLLNPQLPPTGAPLNPLARAGQPQGNALAAGPVYYSTRR